MNRCTPMCAEAQRNAAMPSSPDARSADCWAICGRGWGNVYPLVAPEAAGDIGYDLTELIEAKGYSEVDMVGGRAVLQLAGLRAAARDVLRAQPVRETGRPEVVCHASAWDLDNKDDIRIKMCIKRMRAISSPSIELGHNYYQRAYKSRTTCI